MILHRHLLKGRRCHRDHIWIAALFIETAAGKIGYCALPVVEDQCSIFVILWKTLPKAQQTQISSGFTKEIVEIYPTSQISEILKHKKDRYIFK